jgi:hypothetical protein
MPNHLLKASLSSISATTSFASWSFSSCVSIIIAL